NTIVSKNWTAIPGSHTINIVVDPSNLILELNESNNSKNIDLPEITTSDYIVSNIDWSPDTFSSGESVTFRATLENIGDGSTFRNSNTAFYIDGNIIGSEVIPGLLKGGSIELSKTWTATSGNHTVSIKADQNNQIIESDETNNLLELDITKTKQADLNVSSLTWTPTDFTEGQIVTFNALIENIGNGNTTHGFYTRFLVDGTYLGDKYFSGLSSGSSTNIIHTWIATPGEHTIKTIVDANNHVSESNENNNWRSENISYIQAEYLLSFTSDAESYANGDTATFTAKASRKSDLNVYLGDNDISIILTILNESGSTIFTGPMGYASQAFDEAVDLSGYSQGSYTAYAVLEDLDGVSVDKSISFKLAEDFSVSLSTDRTIYDRDEIVLLTGHAEYTDNRPVIGKPVVLNINIKGSTRTFSLQTDSNGDFSYYYNPNYWEAGSFTATSSVNNEKLWRSAETSFMMYGLSMTPSCIIDYTMSKNSSEELAFTLRNYGDSALNGLAVNIVDEDITDGVDYQLTQSPAQILAPGAKQTFKLKITAENVVTSQARFSISATTDEGSYEEADILFHLVEAVPIAIIDPISITAGINLEDIMLRSVNINNIGYDSMNNVNISEPSHEWISVTPSELESISPGQTKTFDIIVHPTNDTAPGVYQETITISSSNHQPVNIYLTISVTSSQQGDLLFHVVNDISQNLSGASIVIQNQDVLTQVFTGTTNETGYYLFNDISTGRYNYIVKASGHDTGSDSIMVSPLVQTLVEPVLPKNILGVEFTVTPIQIEDDYDIVLDFTFETEVPPPLLIPSPTYIKYGVNFTDPENETDGTISISNPGLISVFNVTVDSSLLAGVNITFPTGKTFFIDEIKAESSITIPYHLNVTSIACGQDSRRNNIAITGNYITFEENSDITHTVYLHSEIPVFAYMYNCPVSPGIPGVGEEIVDHFTFSYNKPKGTYSPNPSPTTKQIQTVETVRERVKFTISQGATLERDAFAASLELTNKLSDNSIDSVKVQLEIKDSEGTDASNIFFMDQTFLENLNSIDGTGIINPSTIATADWLLVPMPGAGGTSPEGNDYTVQAFIDYTVDGVPFSVNSTEERINVMPQPLLNLTYM
ncbi:MAG: hypothetical protein KAI84_16615, partial [Gammaproteobacteria bacterium]|nr:hypothetical protein [Gammaproteobacteria bacterium]